MTAQTAWRVEREPAFDGYTVEWHEPRRFVLSRRNRLFLAVRPGAPIVPLATMPAPAAAALIARLRPAQRLLRFAFYNVVRLDEHAFFLSFDKSAAVLRDGRVQPIEGLLRPARILRDACALDDAGDLYFGEYIANPDRGPVHVYRLPAGSRRVEVVHRFEAGVAKHVHGIFRDPFDDSLWCLTGDHPHECRILRTTDGFRSLDVVGGGDETWRAVSIRFTADAAFYGTDAEFRPNHLYRVDRDGSRSVVAPLEGPVYYSAARGEALFFGVAAELCPSQTSPEAVIWYVDAGGRGRRIAALRKDRLPPRWFLPGTINFAAGPGSADELYFHGVALRGGDRRTLVLRRGGVGPAAADG